MPRWPGTASRAKAASGPSAGSVAAALPPPRGRAGCRSRQAAAAGRRTGGEEGRAASCPGIPARGWCSKPSRVAGRTQSRGRCAAAGGILGLAGGAARCARQIAIPGADVHPPGAGLWPGRGPAILAPTCVSGSPGGSNASGHGGSALVPRCRETGSARRGLMAAPAGLPGRAGPCRLWPDGGGAAPASAAPDPVALAQALAEAILAACQPRRGGCGRCLAPPEEPDLRPALQALAEAGARLALPITPRRGSAAGLPPLAPRGALARWPIRHQGAGRGRVVLPRPAAGAAAGFRRRRPAPWLGAGTTTARWRPCRGGRCWGLASPASAWRGYQPGRRTCPCQRWPPNRG